MIITVKSTHVLGRIFILSNEKAVHLGNFMDIICGIYKDWRRFNC